MPEAWSLTPHLLCGGSSLALGSNTSVAAPEEAKTAVAESSQNNPLSDFGANEWLVDEMYEQYQKDPASVGPEWTAYFTARAGTNGAPDCFTWRTRKETFSRKFGRWPLGGSGARLRSSEMERNASLSHANASRQR